jgi:hypothetical protein
LSKDGRKKKMQKGNWKEQGIEKGYTLETKQSLSLKGIKFRWKVLAASINRISTVK